MKREKDRGEEESLGSLRIGILDRDFVWGRELRITSESESEPALTLLSASDESANISTDEHGEPNDLDLMDLKPESGPRSLPPPSFDPDPKSLSGKSEPDSHGPDFSGVPSGRVGPGLPTGDA